MTNTTISDANVRELTIKILSGLDWIDTKTRDDGSLILILEGHVDITQEDDELLIALIRELNDRAESGVF